MQCSDYKTWAHGFLRAYVASQRERTYSVRVSFDLGFSGVVLCSCVFPVQRNRFGRARARRARRPSSSSRRRRSFHVHANANMHCVPRCCRRRTNKNYKQTTNQAWRWLLSGIIGTTTSTLRVGPDRVGDGSDIKPASQPLPSSFSSKHAFSAHRRCLLRGVRRRWTGNPITSLSAFNTFITPCISYLFWTVFKSERREIELFWPTMHLSLFCRF